MGNDHDNTNTTNNNDLNSKSKSNSNSKINLQRQRAAHLSYGNERWATLTHHDKETIIYPRKWEGAIGPERGVAGIRRYETVKCLHAHAAHYLASCGCACGMAAAAAVEAGIATTTTTTTGAVADGAVVVASC